MSAEAGRRKDDEKEEEEVDTRSGISGQSLHTLAALHTGVPSHPSSRNVGKGAGLAQAPRHLLVLEA